MHQITEGKKEVPDHNFCASFSIRRLCVAVVICIVSAALFKKTPRMLVTCTEGTAVYCLVQTHCHIWPGGTDCRSCEGLWSARSQEGRALFTASLLSFSAGTSQSGGSCESDVAAPELCFLWRGRAPFPSVRLGVGGGVEGRGGVTSFLGRGGWEGLACWQGFEAISRDVVLSPEVSKFSSSSTGSPEPHCTHFHAVQHPIKTHLASISHLVHISCSVAASRTALRCKQETDIAKQHRPATGYLFFIFQLNFTAI